MCNRIYIFNFKKQTSKKNKKNKARIQKKAKETNEEKIIFPENRFKKMELRLPAFPETRVFPFGLIVIYCTALDSHILVAPN